MKLDRLSLVMPKADVTRKNVRKINKMLSYRRETALQGALYSCRQK